LDNKNSNQTSEFDEFDFTQDNKSAKLKKAVFLIAILAVVFVIVFIVSTSFTSSGESDSSTAPETEEFMDLESDPFFSEMAPSRETTNNFEPNPRNDRPEPFNTAIDDNIEIPEPAPAQPESSAMDYLEKDKIFNSSEPTAEKVVEEYDVFQEQPKPVVKPQPEPVVTSMPVQNSNLTVDRKYYIQTGTFFKYKPNEKYLKKIMELQLTYHLDTYVSNEKELTRVLIGPFESKAEANEKLPTVHEHIEKSAYILKTRLH
jgi:DedD protein